MGMHQSEYGIPLDEGSATIRREEKDTVRVNVRRYEASDCAHVVRIAYQNFAKSYALFPENVVNAYREANRAADLKEAVDADGTEAYVAESNGKIVGFYLARYNPYVRRSPSGELELRRLHVDVSAQRNGIGTTLFDHIDQRAKDIQVTQIVSLASGSSRPFFEHKGWRGRTTLHPMGKRGTAAIVFEAHKLVIPEEIQLPLAQPTHIVYAGENPYKEEYIRNLTGFLDRQIHFYSVGTEENPYPDVLEAARSKAYSVKIRPSAGVNPLIVAGDTRTDLLILAAGSQTRYMLANRGKPSNNPDQSMLDNFRLLLQYARETNRPAAYIIRSATYIHSPQNYEGDTYTESDVSIWLSREGLEVLATEQGAETYRREVIGKYSVDPNQMAAGFSLPVFLERGYVTGINGHPIDTIPHKDRVLENAKHTALVGIDGSAIKKQLGYLR
ncbi:MAG: GNAT family N-acetyltransferase [Patescibacteria group bacterium]|nr:GNAT family N-acetyltransferase [Patescibacteria group bacterium]